MKSQLLNTIKEILQALQLPVEHCTLARPDNPDHGTYTTNVAFVLGKQLKQNPIALAQQIKTELEKKKDQTSSIESIHVAGPGFLNITLTPHAIIQYINNPEQQTPLNKRLVIEYTQPNPFKEMHIGHLYSNAVGESLSRLYEQSGWTVRRVNYQGDVGLHVAKALWGLLKLRATEHKHLSINEFLENLQTLSLDERINILGKAYAAGSQHYEQEEIKKEIQQLNIMIFIAAQRMHKEQSGWNPVINYSALLSNDTSLSLTQDELYALYTRGRSWSLEYFEQRYTYLGTHFDAYYFESRIAELGYQMVLENIQNGIFEKDSGAVVYKGEKRGLHTRVFINSLGLPVYEAKDLGLAPTKYDDWKYDLSIIETAKEINEYFKVVLSALKDIRPDLEEKTVHISHGLVKLPEGKMSSRTGNILTADWLIQQVEEEIKHVLESSKRTYSKQELSEIIHVLTVATIKYSLLKVALPADISFNIKNSVSLEGDSGPYLVYTYARCKSVLQKTDAQYDSSVLNTQHAWNKEEISLLRTLFYYKEIQEESREHNSPSTLCRYLIHLAQLFNTFYAKHQIIHSESELQTAGRIYLTSLTAETIKKGLHVLGIQTVERM